MDEKPQSYLPRKDIIRVLVLSGVVLWFALFLIACDIIYDAIPGRTFLISALRWVIDVLVFAVMAFMGIHIFFRLKNKVFECGDSSKPTNCTGHTFSD